MASIDGAKATAFLGRFGQAFKASAPSPAAPTTAYEALVRRVDAGGQFDEFMGEDHPVYLHRCCAAASCRGRSGSLQADASPRLHVLRAGVASGGWSLGARRRPTDGRQHGSHLHHEVPAGQEELECSAAWRRARSLGAAYHRPERWRAAVSQLDPNAKALVNSLATALESDGSPSPTQEI